MRVFSKFFLWVPEGVLNEVSCSAMSPENGSGSVLLLSGQWSTSAQEGCVCLGETVVRLCTQ